jgi:hypothetical protein
MPTRSRNDEARIYSAPTPSPDPTTPMRVSGCVFGQNEVLPFDTPGDLVFAFRGSALALAGHIAGVAAEICGVVNGVA